MPEPLYCQVWFGPPLFATMKSPFPIVEIWEPVVLMPVTAVQLVPEPLCC